MRIRTVTLLGGLGLAAAAFSPGSVASAAPAVEAATSGTYPSADGLELHWQAWRPRGDVRAVLVLVHGLEDYGGRYGDVATRLAGDGVAVYAPDLRGHGTSEGKRSYVRRFSSYEDDLDRFFALVREQQPGKPVFLFGHSMGGAIVTEYTLHRKPDLAGLILSGAALEVTPDVTPGLVHATRVISSLFPHARVLDLPDDRFSRDPAVVAAQEADPLVWHHKEPARVAAGILGAMEDVQAHWGELTVPLLAMHGSADVITNPQGTRDLVAHAGSADKTLKIYDGLYHDLLHEPEKQLVADDLVSWLEARCPPAPAAPAPPPAPGPGPAPEAP